MTKLALTLAAVVSLGMLSSAAYAEEHAAPAAADTSVTCVVNEVELMAKTAEDCTKAGGMVKAAEAAPEHTEEGHAEPAKH